MEVSGAYIAGNNFNIPVVSIRVISNNKIKGQEYDEKYGILSQKYTINLLNKLINN